jgi:hypothetical protein
MTSDTPKRGHHPDSPSSLQATAQCPHFANQDRESEASVAGTLQHLAAEKRDLSLLDDESHVAAVTRAIALEDATINALRGSFVVEVIREQYLPVCADEKRGEWEGITGGYPDTLLLASSRESEQALAVLLDWKFGKHLVTPTRLNLQGIAYALAVFQKYAKVAEVKVVFFHPHIEVSGQLPEYTHIFSREDVPDMELKIRFVLAQKEAAKRGEVPAHPSANLCVWCAKLATCEAVRRIATVTSAKYESLVVPEEVRPAYISLPEDMRKAHVLASTLEKFCKAVKARVRDAVITEGAEVPGLKPVTKADREIVSIAAVRDVALQHGVTVEQFESCLSITLGAVEEAVKKTAPRGKGAAAVREFASALDDVGAVKKGKPYTYLVEGKSIDNAIDV